MTNITYVYSGNRKNRYYQKKFEAREFFYGLNLFDIEINLCLNLFKTLRDFRGIIFT